MGRRDARDRGSGMGGEGAEGSGVGYWVVRWARRRAWRTRIVRDGGGLGHRNSWKGSGDAISDAGSEILRERR